MTVSVFIGTSVDGFIARPDGALDFLPEDCEPHGYDEFIAGVDALVIGRNTFETVLAFPEWPYGKKRVVVLSSRPLDLSAAGARLSNKCPEIRLKSLRNSLLPALTTFMSTEV
jgi:dihydrofolate reductase